MLSNSMLSKIIITITSSIVVYLLIYYWKNIRHLKCFIFTYKIYRYRHNSNNILYFTFSYIIYLFIVNLMSIVFYKNINPINISICSNTLFNYFISIVVCFFILPIIIFVISYKFSKYYLYKILMNARNVQICDYKTSPYINTKGIRYYIITTLSNDAYLCQTKSQIQNLKYKFEIISPSKIITAHLYCSILLFRYKGKRLKDHIQEILIFSILINVYIIFIIIALSNII